MPNLFQQISSVIVRVLDEWISVIVGRFNWRQPTGPLRQYVRLSLGFAYLWGVLVGAVGVFDFYQLGIVQQAFRFLRDHHPLVLAQPIFIVFLVLAAALAAFKGANKGGYGLCELMAGTVSAVGLLLIVVRSEKPMSDTELVVALCGSLYLAAEGISLVIESEEAKANQAATPPERTA
jgi:hypothetical protein